MTREEFEALLRKVEHMATSQAQLDTDLQALSTQVQNLITAYNSASAKAGAAGVDLTAEDQQVQAAGAAIQAALNPTPAPTPTPDA